MTVAPQHTTSKMTLEEFLTYDDGTDAGYELENGELFAVYGARGIAEYWIVDPMQV